MTPFTFWMDINMNSLSGKNNKNKKGFCSTDHLCSKCSWRAEGREFCKVFMQPITDNQYQCASFEMKGVN